MLQAVALIFFYHGREIFVLIYSESQLSKTTNYRYTIDTKIHGFVPCNLLSPKSYNFCITFFIIFSRLESDILYSETKPKKPDTFFIWSTGTDPRITNGIME
jgi:hypothetical protein